MRLRAQVNTEVARSNTKIARLNEEIDDTKIDHTKTNDDSCWPYTMMEDGKERPSTKIERYMFQEGVKDGRAGHSPTQDSPTALIWLLVLTMPLVTYLVWKLLSFVDPRSAPVSDAK